MAEKITIRPPDDISREFGDLVARCYQKDPAKKDLRELEKTFKEMSQLWKAVFDLGKVVRNRAIDNLRLPEVATLTIRTNITEMQRELGYQDAPALERLLIDNVLNCWVRLQWCEFTYSSKMDSSMTFREGDYWTKLLNAAQRRYLRAAETLARVRKLTRNTPMLQVNIATQEGQQVNIGQVVKGEKPTRQEAI